MKPEHIAVYKQWKPFWNTRRNHVQSTLFYSLNMKRTINWKNLNHLYLVPLQRARQTVEVRENLNHSMISNARSARILISWYSWRNTRKIDENLLRTPKIMMGRLTNKSAVSTLASSCWQILGSKSLVLEDRFPNQLLYNVSIDNYRRLDKTREDRWKPLKELEIRQNSRHCCTVETDESAHNFQAERHTNHRPDV